MQIVCPHCSTSYAVDAARFGSSGRTVRCARCKETWMAMPEPDFATTAADPEWDTPAHDAGPDVPHVESPPITADMPQGDEASPGWTTLAREDAVGADDEPAPARGLRARLGLGKLSLGPLARRSTAVPAPAFGARRKHGWMPNPLQAACLVMMAGVIGLVAWRSDVVRLMPQTAGFYRMIGLAVNLRGLAFDDVRVTTEVVDNKPVLVIEGNVVQLGKKPLEVPRLRFIVRDAKGTDIYSWNAMLEQTTLKPGEKAWFRSRLASPPPEGHEIAVRFFNRKDLAAGA
jgi:predicted Zn finger-like uncharacterized protein